MPVPPSTSRLDLPVGILVGVAPGLAWWAADGGAASRPAFWSLLLAGAFVAAVAVLTLAIRRRRAREAARDAKRIGRLKSLYDALSQTTRLILTETQESVLLERICAICVNAGHAHMTSIHLLAGSTIHRTTHVGLPPSYYASFPESWDIDDARMAASMASQVIRTGERKLRQDYQAEMPSELWRALARQYGIEAAASFPIRRDGVVRGSFSLYASETNFFDDALLSVIEELVDALSFALDNLARKEALRAAAAATQAQKAAEAANEAKTLFLSKISHELRTPLHAILGFTQLLERDAGDRLPPADGARLAQIRQAGWHLLSLVNDVLDVSRIESGRFDLLLRGMDVDTVLAEVIQLVEHTASKSAVRIRVRPESAHGLGVSADPVRLRQVLLNLLSNAVKYNRPGGHVGVTVARAAAHVEICIADTGMGMSVEQLAHLFEPFNRLGRERGGIEGTGLGLALTRQLIELMAGSLSFESRLGEGTRATLRLPAAEPAAAPPARGAHDDDAAAPAPALHGQVLYIEDNDINVMIVEQMLADWPDVRFANAASGQAGIALARALRPDLVLLDMNLPDMGGVEILTALRADADTRDIRVVVLSASAMADEIDGALRCGALDYWTKPVDFRTFMAKLGKLLPH
jgi:signal transduction histidine kinase